MDLYAVAVLNSLRHTLTSQTTVLSTLINRQIIMGHLHGKTAKHSWRVKEGKFPRVNGAELFIRKLRMKVVKEVPVVSRFIFGISIFTFNKFFFENLFIIKLFLLLITLFFENLVRTKVLRSTNVKFQIIKLEGNVTKVGALTKYHSK